MSWNNSLGKVSKGWKLKSVLYGEVAAPSYNRGRIVEKAFKKSESGVITREVYPKLPTYSGLYSYPSGISSQLPGVHIKDR